MYTVFRAVLCNYRVKITFSASADAGAFQGAFFPFTPNAQILSQDYPTSFWFSEEPFFGSFVASFSSDGLYIIYGNLEDYRLIGIVPPEGYEVDSLLGMSALYVKVVEGNAIEITPKQYQHDFNKNLMEKDQAKALDRIQNEFDYGTQHVPTFAVEADAYDERYVPVGNPLGQALLADNGDLHQKMLSDKAGSFCKLHPDKCTIIPYCKYYIIDETLNQAVSITGKIQYDSLYPAGTSVLSNRLVYLSIRSWVYMTGIDCTKGAPNPLYTVKSILYPFYTDAMGNISGTVYMAPPFDSGLPYLEYAETRSDRIYAVTQDTSQTDVYNYEM
jgi:hypothetical protein